MKYKKSPLDGVHKRLRVVPPLWRRGVADVLAYLSGGILYAVSVNVFSAPNHIAPGGVTGIATLINYVTGLPIGLLIVAINLPLLAAAWKWIGRGYTVRTTIATVVTSAVIDLSAPYVTPFHGDTMLVAVFGGVLAGTGLGLIYMRGATTGGSEVIAGLLERRWPHISIGRLILLVDAVVVAVSAAVYRQLDRALYAMVLIFVSTALLDTLIYGRSKGKLLLIVTDHAQTIAQGILTTLHRGVTMLEASGAYTGSPKQVLLCAVRPQEVYSLRLLIKQVDPAAFVIITTSDEVNGEGFALP